MDNFTKYEKSLAENAAFAYANMIVKEADEAGSEQLTDVTVKQSIEFLDTWFYAELDKVEKDNRKRPQQIRRRRMLKVAAVIVAAIALSTTVLVGTVEAVRIEALNIVRTIFSTHTEFRLDNVEEENSERSAADPAEYSDLHWPAYVPDGFVLKEIVGGDNHYLMLYQSDDGSYLRIEQTETQSGMGVDTQDAIVEQVLLHEEPATLIMKDEIISIYMKSGAYAYLLNSPLQKDEMMRIAESIE